MVFAETGLKDKGVRPEGNWTTGNKDIILAGTGLKNIRTSSLLQELG